MKKTYSLKVIITSFLVIFTILVVSIIFVFQILFLDDFYRINKLNDMNTVISGLENGIMNNDLYDTMHHIEVNHEVCVRIDTRKSNFYTKTNESNACALRYLTNDQINHIYNETVEHDDNMVFDNFKLSGDNDNDIFIMSRVIDYHGEDILLLVSSLITPLNATIKTLNSQLLIVSIIIIIAVIVVGFIASKAIIRPLKLMNDEASDLPSGEYDASRIKTGVLEFDELNNTLDKAKDLINQADVARKELLSNVSHDLRTPLTMIVGYGEMMKDFVDERNDENIDLIIEEAKRLSTLVNDLLDLSKGELGHLELNRKDVSINEILLETYHQYEKYMTLKAIDFSYDVGYDEIINVDVRRFKQVLYNFLNNAINYNDNPHPVIKLSSEVDKDHIIISVYDNGNGIKKEDLNKVWDRYYKVDKEHKRQGLGSGIGLSICKMILDMHHFDYSVESKYGEYTCFKIMIPIQKQL